MTLSTKQRAFLRGLGQQLRPQVHIGHGGYSEAHVGALEDLLKRRELVKVRLLNTTEEDPDEVAARMAAAAGAAVVGVVGKTFVLYRPNPDIKDPIVLPERGPAGGRRSTPRG